MQPTLRTQSQPFTDIFRKGTTLLSKSCWLCAASDAPLHLDVVALGTHSAIMLPPTAVDTSPSGGAAFPAASCIAVSASAK